MLHAAAETALREAHAVTAAADALDRRAHAMIARSAVPGAPLHHAHGGVGISNGVPSWGGDASAAPQSGPHSSDDVLLGVIGGLKAASQPLSTCEAWHPSLGWRSLPALSCARAYCAVACAGPRRRAADSIVYAIGGSGGGSPLDTVETLQLGPHVSAMQVPDRDDALSLPGWRRIAHLAKPRVWHAACALGETIYTVGGFDGRSYIADAEVLDISVDAPRGMWSAIKVCFA